MLSTLLEVPNPAEDQAIQMVAPALETDDAIPLAKALLERLGGVFSIPLKIPLLPFLLRVSVRTDDMAGNTDEWSGHIRSQLSSWVPYALPTGLNGGYGIEHRGGGI